MQNREQDILRKIEAKKKIIETLTKLVTKWKRINEIKDGLKRRSETQKFNTLIKNTFPTLINKGILESVKGNSTGLVLQTSINRNISKIAARAEMETRSLKYLEESSTTFQEEMRQKTIDTAAEKRGEQLRNLIKSNTLRMRDNVSVERGSEIFTFPKTWFEKPKQSKDTNESRQNYIIKILADIKRILVDENVDNRARYFIKIGDQIHNINAITDNLNEVVLVEHSGDNSDAEVNYLTLADLIERALPLENNDITLIKTTEQGRRTIEGQFFKYLHKLEGMDLRRYGIYPIKYTEDDMKEINANSCFYTAMKQAGLKDEKLDTLKSMLTYNTTPKSDIAMIALRLGVNIDLHEIKKRKDNHKMVEKYRGEPKHDKVYQIALCKSHYFVYDDVEISPFFFTHHKELQKVKIERRYKINRIKDGKHIIERGRLSKINSLDMVRLLIEHKDDLLEHFDTSNGINNCIHKKKAPQKILKLKPAIKPVLTTELNKKKKEKKYEDIFWADIESYQDDKLRQIPYQSAVISRNKNQYTEFTENLENKTIHKNNCITRMLKYIITGSKKGDEFLVYFHNLSYDSKFITQYLSHCSRVSKGQVVYSLSGYYLGKKITFNCTYRLTGQSLKMFGESMCIQVAKEVFPYNAMSKDVIINQELTVIKALEALNNEEDRIRFIDNLIENNFIYKTILDRKHKDENMIEYFNRIDDAICPDMVNIIEYSSFYLRKDVEVLKAAYEEFKKKCEEMFQIDLTKDGILTSASLAHNVMLKKGVYDGVVSMGGNQSEFFSKSIVGGRCMLANNEKIIVAPLSDDLIETFYLMDYDACSLYPSAMSRLKGIPEGEPEFFEYGDSVDKILEEQNALNIFNLKTREDRKQRDDVDIEYTVDVLVKKNRKKLRFPLLSIIDDETGSRNFTNKFEGKIYTMNRIQLEDLVEFHNLQEEDIEIQRGYVWIDPVYNTKIMETIKDIYQMRVKYKKEKSGTQAILKLVMNSAYGKTIQKAHDSKEEIKDFADEEEMIKYMAKNYNTISRADEINPIHKDEEAKKKYIVKKITTTNTSMNMPHVGAMILAMSKRIMNEVMCLAEDIGIDLYYQDTDSIHMKGEDIPKLQEAYYEKYGRELTGGEMGQFHGDFQMDGCRDVVSKMFIGLGKKAYLDVLEGKNDKGEKVRGHHIRMKGCTTESILEHGDPVETYKKLFDGEKISFDLTAGGKASFDMRKNLGIYNRESFIRSVAFK